MRKPASAAALIPQIFNMLVELHVVGTRFRRDDGRSLAPSSTTPKIASSTFSFETMPSSTRMCKMKPLSSRRASVAGWTQSALTISLLRRLPIDKALAVPCRLQIVENGNPDPNAVVPLRVEIDLAKGHTV